MGTFKNTLVFFQEKESTSSSLHKFVLKKESRRMAAETQVSSMKYAGSVPPLLDTLYFSPVSFRLILVTKIADFFFTAEKQLSTTPMVLRLHAYHLEYLVEALRRANAHLDHGLLRGEAREDNRIRNSSRNKRQEVAEGRPADELAIPDPSFDLLETLPLLVVGHQHHFR
jgi:hypothetical protein